MTNRKTALVLFATLVSACPELNMNWRAALGTEAAKYDRLEIDIKSKPPKETENTKVEERLCTYAPSEEFLKARMRDTKEEGLLDNALELFNKRTMGGLGYSFHFSQFPDGSNPHATVRLRHSGLVNRYNTIIDETVDYLSVEEIKERIPKCQRFSKKTKTMNGFAHIKR